MRIKNSVCVVALAAAITGCGLMGPSYEKPNTSNPGSFPSRDNLTAVESANLPAMAWWKSFNDPVLNKLIESALKNNNNIQVAIGNITAAQGYLRSVQFAWIPTASGSAGYATKFGDGHDA